MPTKPTPRQTFIPKPAKTSTTDNASEDANTGTNDNANANVSTRPPVARFKDETMKTAGLRMPVWIADEWSQWCKDHGWAVGPTAGQALLEYMERHKEG